MPRLSERTDTPSPKGKPRFGISNFRGPQNYEAGADRLEICQDLSVGGVTPTAGFLNVIKKLVNIPVFVLIRPRAGDFHYDSNEVEQMVEDIRIFRKYGADGFVFGALTDNKESIDVSICQELITASSGLPVTFHRAFDEIKEAKRHEALEQIISLGFHRILTSGGARTAILGMNSLAALVTKADSRIIIMPGGGIRDLNIEEIIHVTNAAEYHSSGRRSDVSAGCPDIGLTNKNVVALMKGSLDSSNLP